MIRREFDIAEGDAYNRVLVDRAERRLKNLAYFKSVRITTEPGSASDRVILNVDVEEQSTGEFSIAGGYSTADGLVGEVSVGERNLLGRGQFARASVTLRPAHPRHRSVVHRAVFPGLSRSRSASISSPSRSTRRRSTSTGRRPSAARCASASRCARTSACSRATRSTSSGSRSIDLLRNCNNINPNFGLVSRPDRNLSDPARLGTTPATHHRRRWIRRHRELLRGRRSVGCRQGARSTPVPRLCRASATASSTTRSTTTRTRRAACSPNCVRTSPASAAT